MNSGDPGSPLRRGPPRQAYQYFFVVPSASLATVQCSPLALMRILPFRFFRLFAQPAFNFIGRHRLSTAVFDDDADAARRVNVEALDLNPAMSADLQRRVATILLKRFGPRGVRFFFFG